MYTDEYTQESTASSILTVIDEIRGLFRNHFESGWFLIILERMSFNSVYLNDIRNLIELQSIYPADFYQIKTGAVAVEEFVTFARRYVLPVLRDELGISGFTRHSVGDRDRTTQVVKEFFASTFPHNVQKLADLSEELSRLVDVMAAEERLAGPGFNAPPSPSSIPAYG